MPSTLVKLVRGLLGYDVEEDIKVSEELLAAVNSLTAGGCDTGTALLYAAAKQDRRDIVKKAAGSRFESQRSTQKWADCLTCSS
jgi:hypothetical protein